MGAPTTRGMGIEVQGLDEFSRKMGLAGKELQRVTRVAIRRTGNTLRARGRDNAGRIGRAPFRPELGRTIQLEIAGDGLIAVVGSLATTARSIEEGRHAGDMPRVGLVLGWMNREGLVTREAAIAGAAQSIATHVVQSRGRKSARAKSIIAAQRHAAWKIAIAIKAHGTRPLPFLTPAVREVGGDVERYFREAAADLLSKMAVRR